MDFNCINKFFQEYNEFKKCLANKLNNNLVELKGETCYLIENNWMDELLLYCNKFNDLKELDYNKLNIKNPNLLDILNAERYIEKQKGFVIITDKIIQILLKNSLDDKKLFKFYIGNNILIIEDPQQNNYALLYSNPFDEDLSRRKGNLIQISGQDKKEFFKLFLMNNSERKSDPNQYFPDYLLTNTEKNLSPIDELRLRISIMLFYYEQYLISPENKFSIYQKYYLINYKWMNAFKEYIKYEEVSDSLTQYNNKLKNKISYANLDIDKFLKYYSYDFTKNLKEDNCENYKSIELTALKLYTQTIGYYQKCYIIHYKIADLIKKVDPNIKINDTSKVISKINNKNIFLLENQTISIGNFHEKIFLTKYVISYNSNVKFENELSILLDTDLYKYFMNNNCDIQKVGLQDLEENKILKGKLLILIFVKPKKKNSFSYKILKEINANKKDKLNKTYIYNTYNIEYKENKNKKKKHKIIPIGLKKEKKFIIKKEKNESTNLKKIEESEQKEEEKENKAKEQQNKEKNKLKRKEETTKEKLIKKEINIKNHELQKYQENLEKIENKKKMKNNQRNNEISQINDNENSKDQLQINPSFETVFPKLKGLNKVGGIPYMNAILQCLIQIKSLTFSFLKETDRIRKYDEDECELSKSYLTLIEELWETNRKSQYDPYNFKNVVNSYDKSFERSNSDKIRDFIDFILEQLHQELKRKKINERKLIQNDSDKEIIYKNILEKFQKENSIISEEFFGIVETSYKCLECNNNLIYYNYEILKYIVFNLEEIKSIINSNNNDSNNNKITIDDSFNTIYNNNIFIRESNYFCYTCNKLTRCKYYSKLLKLPNTLIIILDRNINKMNPIEFDFHNEIKIIQKNYENNNSQNILYELYGVVTCTNQTEPTEQHFVAFCKCSINNKWYKYDYMKISDSINDIQKDIIEYKVPFVLFYKKRYNKFFGD